MPPDVVGVQDAKLDNPSGLVEEQRNGNHSKYHDEKLTGDHEPGDDGPVREFQGPQAPEEGDGRDHEEEGDDEIGKGEVF